MKKGLSADNLAVEALRIVDNEGLKALTMRRLATQLGVDPMAAYRHVPHKNALLDLVVDAVLREIDLSALEGPWQQRLKAGTKLVHDTLAAHPNAAPLFAERTWTTPAGLRVVDWGLGVLAEGGVEPERAVLVINATGLFLSSLVAAEHASSKPDLSGIGQLPHLAAIVAAGYGRISYDALLEFWLDAALSTLK